MARHRRHHARRPRRLPDLPPRVRRAAARLPRLGRHLAEAGGRASRRWTTLPRRTTPTSTAGVYTLAPGGDRRCSRARGRAWRRSSAGRPPSTIFTAQRDRGDQPRRLRLGTAATSAAATRCCSRRWSTTRTSSPGSCIARSPAPSCATSTSPTTASSSLDQLDEELAARAREARRRRPRLQRAGDHQPGRRDRRARARGRRASRWSTARRRVPQLPVDVAAIGSGLLRLDRAQGARADRHRRAARPPRDLLEAMRPFLGGGDMIRDRRARLTRRGTTCRGSSRRGRRTIAEAVGLGAAVDYLGSLGMENVRAHELALARYALERLGELPRRDDHGPGRRRGPRRRDLLRGRGHPPARRGRAARPRQRLRPRRTSLRACR